MFASLLREYFRVYTLILIYKALILIIEFLEKKLELD